MPLFGPKYKPIVGLDIGTSVIRAMEVRPSGRNWRLHRCHQANLPSTMIVDGKIKKSDEAVEFIKNFHKEGKFTTHRIALSIGGPSIISKKIIVDKMTEMELEDQIALEAEEYIPFDIEEVFLDFQILGDADDRMAVLLTACKKDFANDKLDICRSAGLEPQILDLDCLCLANAYATFNAPTKKKIGKPAFFNLKKKPGTRSASSPKEPPATGKPGEAKNSNEPADPIIALANIGGQYLNTIVMVGGRIEYTRDLSFGAKPMITELIEHTGMTMEAVQQALQTPEIASPASALHEAWENIVLPYEAKLTTQIRQSLDFFQASRPHKEQANLILLSGGGAGIAGIDQRLSQQVGIPVELFNPAQKLKRDQGRKAPVMNHSSGFTVSLGLALRGLSS
ncbi:MAG: type IV pilus assembly protein PilM [Magnetococcales bacterium]|nr:type IV pilus assembly protein PilM [Magnetococcales bacterium]MBF0151354.1 type IV pilus assembly protein PilM [Magnetococcales bacterium]MBF0172987.1 type IV pilus assembly protein PilM [Magnetococcales bacterium]MBF0348275.1 type IV pilus assembly protein PilM [Magnetococcales bacterium]MBF0631952.1 type IV pilus assembly protein PilM [Magnetococcales bacterium]